MSRILFESQRPAAQVDPGRADIACFVGLVRCLPGAVIPPAVQTWLNLQGWVSGPYARPLSPIFDVPIPIENYAAFTALFDPGGSAASVGTDYLAVAVRSFFAQGARRCYVVRMGDPVTQSDTPAMRQATLQSMLPSNIYAVDDQRGWHGVTHLEGLPDVSFLAMPDLPALSASVVEGAQGQEPVAATGPERFVECSNTDVTATAPLQYNATAPRLAPSDYTRWAAAVQSVLLYLSTGSLREMLLVAAFPMPLDTDVAAAAEDPSTSLTPDIHAVINAVMPEPQGDETGLSIGISSAFCNWPIRG